MKDLSIYIHIPFCKDKCFYCDFLSFKNKDEYFLDYIKPLISEIKGFENKHNYIIKSIFFGGGTPSLIPEQYIVDILRVIFSEFNVYRFAEISIEANPGTLTLEKLLAYRDLNVNRLSIGLQAWQDNILKDIGRIHTSYQFIENFNMARKVGFDNINIDIIFGLPNQTFDNLIETLENVVALSPEHISAYSLIVEDGTKFNSLYNKGLLNLPDEDTERNMYHYVVDFLKENGYNHYEISNFAKNDKKCYHNLVYWEQKEYIGFGLGSSSFLDYKRFSNDSNFNNYINGNNDRTFESLELQDFYSEYVFMGLRKIDGISINDFQNKFNVSIYDVFGETILKMKNLELLQERGGRISLTPRGIDISNYVFSEFLN